MTDLIEIAKKRLQSLSLEILKENGLERAVEGYLFTTTYPSLSEMGQISIDSIVTSKNEVFSLYVHIPFCSRRCTYCNFATGSSNDDLKNRYINALKKELDLWVGNYPHIRIGSIYFGGGTPTTLESEDLCNLLGYIRDKVTINKDAEITIEIHPEMIRREDSANYFSQLKKAGFNRVSIGVQSFVDEELGSVNRGHTSQEAKDLFNLLRSLKFDNINLDLMYCLPHQTIESWQRTLDEAYSLKPDSITTYRLEVKKTSRIYREFQTKPEDFHFENQHLMNVLSMLKADEEGYVQDPIGWFVKKGKGCRQQKDKWSIRKPQLLPLGVATYGFVNNVQYYNVPSIQEYIISIERGKLPLWKGKRLDNQEIMARTTLFGIKTGGIDKREFHKFFGIDFDNKYENLIGQLQKLGLIKNTDEYISLTEKGILLNEEIAMLFTPPSHISEPRTSLIERYRQTCKRPNLRS